MRRKCPLHPREKMNQGQQLKVQIYPEEWVLMQIHYCPKGCHWWLETGKQKKGGE